MPDGARLPHDVKPRGAYRTLCGNDVVKAIEGVGKRRKQKRYIKLRCTAACTNKACHGEPLRECMQRLLTSGGMPATDEAAGHISPPAVEPPAAHPPPPTEHEGDADDGDESSEFEMSAEEEDEYDGEGERSEARVTLAQGAGTSEIALEETAGEATVVGTTAVRGDGDGRRDERVKQKKKRRHTRSVRLEERKRRRTDDNDDDGLGGRARGQADGRG